MKNKIKLFDRGTYVEAVNRLKIPGIIMGSIFLASGLILVLSCVVELMDYSLYSIPTEYFYITYLIPFVMVPMMMMSAFSYLRVRKTSDFYHALPIKRETLYTTTIMAAVTWIIAELILASIIPLIAALVSPSIKIDMVLYWEVILKAFIISVLVLSGFSMGVSLTGNGFTNFFVALMILFVPRTISTIVASMAEEFTPFLVLNMTNSLLNNQYNAIFREIDLYGDTIPMFATVIYSLILAGIYFVVGAVAFVKRKSEMAGKPSAFKGVQVASRMILPFICLLGALFFFMYWTRFYTDEVYFLIFALSMVTTSFTIYFIYELVTVRKIKKVLKSLVWYPLLVGGVILIGIIISIGSQIAVNRKVDADKIKYLMVENMGWYTDKNFVRVEDERAFEIIEDAYETQIETYCEDYSEYMYFDEYSDTNVIVGINQGGVTFYRIIDLEYDEYIELYQIYEKQFLRDDLSINLPRYNSMNVYYDYYFLSLSAERKIYETLVKEIEDYTWEELNDYDEDEFVTFVRVEDYNRYGNYSIDIPISDATPKTLEAFVNALVTEDVLMYGEDVYDDCLKHYEKGYEISLILNETYIIRDGEKIEQLMYTGLSTDDALADKTLEIFEKLEESEEGDNIIILAGCIELTDYKSDYAEYIASADIGNKYYVSDELLEEFLEYISEIHEIQYGEKQ